jgi:hypothetical protein
MQSAKWLKQNKADKVLETDSPEITWSYKSRNTGQHKSTNKNNTNESLRDTDKT